MDNIAKRLFDIIGSTLGLILLAPLLVLIAVAVKMDSKGPALFWQIRVGLNGKHFFLLKYRTMIPDAQKMGRETLGTNDFRITKLGHLLRRTKFDELPQLINILLGEMSFVGPRPEIPFYVAQYSKEDKIVLSVRPGLTDPSSVTLANLDAVMESRGNQSAAKFYANHVLPAKLKLQKEYIKEKTFFGDIKIIFATLLKILSAGRI